MDREALRALAEWETALAAPGLTFGTWEGGQPDANGVIQMPWFAYSETADAFRAAVAGAGWVTPLDWRSWAATPDGHRLQQDPMAIAAAGVTDLRFLLTTIFRSDRFHEGSIASAQERGILLAIARRAGTLLAEGDAGAQPPSGSR